MSVLDSLQIWIKGTALYNNFLLRMPAPLNNIYFDTILLALAFVYFIYRIVDGMQMSKRHRRVKERQLELQEKAAENEIHLLNHEREARNSKEEMSQFMRFMEMSMMATTTKQITGADQPQQSFEQFQARERQEQLATTRENVQDAFDTVDMDETDAASVVSAPDAAIISENESLARQLESLRIENMQMQEAFAEKERLREADMTRIKADMEQKEKEKQTKIDKLQSALGVEKENAQKQLQMMTKNLDIYKADKEKEIADLTAKLSDTNATPDEKQAEIDRLREEMKRIHAGKEQEIAEKEKEYQREAKEKEQEISRLTKEMEEMKSKHGAAMTQINDAFEQTQLAQQDAKDQSATKIEQLRVQLEQVKKEKEAEIVLIKSGYDQTVADLKTSLDAEKKKAEALSLTSLEQSEEIAKMQNMIAEAEDKESDEYRKNAESLDFLRSARADTDAKKQAAQRNIEHLNKEISTKSDDAKNQIEKTEAEIKQIASAQEGKIDPAMDVPQSVVKPFYSSQSQVEVAGSLFDELIRNCERNEDLMKEAEATRRSQEENERLNRQQLERQLIKEVREDEVREKHGEDEAKLRAIEEQKERIKQEELKSGGTEKKKHGFFRIKH